MKPKKNALQEEIFNRVAKKKLENARESFDIKELCFPKQLSFLQDKATRKTAVCSRRAGKTNGCGKDLMESAANVPEGDFAYITLNRRTAKKIIWRELNFLNTKYNFGAEPNNQELTMTFPTGVMIHVSGAKDETEIEKFRGLALRKTYIDEAQAFRPYIKDLIEDVIEPALIDYNGSLILTGTPGPVASGFFYECSHNPEWSNHAWTIHDNPWILTKSGREAEAIIDEVCKRRGVDRNSPSIRREFYGEWVHDYDSLVYLFNKDKNVYISLPEKPLIYIFGIDLGYQDSDAIAVIGYCPETNMSYLVEEWVKNKQAITPLVNKIKELEVKYKPVKMVMDAGALGRKIQEEIRQRHSLNVFAATKERKFEFIELMNDDLRSGKFQAKPNSAFEQDSYLVQWDYDNPEKPKVSDSYHTDIGDAVLYAWRECKHYIRQDKKIILTDDQYMESLEAKEAEAMELKVQAEKEQSSINSWEDLGVDENDDYSDIY